jgi:L-ribulokinase
MGQGFDIEYHPNKELAGIYEKRYEKYKKFGSFVEEQMNEVIKETRSESKKMATA